MWVETMTQLLDPSPDSPYVCIWDDDVPCEIRPLIDHGVSEQQLLEAVFNNDFPPIAPSPVPAPAGFVLLSSVIVAVLFKRWLDFYGKNR